MKAIEITTASNSERSDIQKALDVLGNVGWIFGGDSLQTPDWGASSISSLLAELEDGGLIALRNFAVSGQTTTKIRDLYASQAHLYAPKNGERIVYSVDGMINDIQEGESTAAIISRLTSIYANAKADNLEVMAWTMHDWTDDATKKAKTATINDWLLANQTQFDYLLRMDLLFPTYAGMEAQFEDRIHPNAIGRMRMVQAMYSLVPHGPANGRKFTGSIGKDLFVPNITTTGLLTIERATPSGYNKINFNTKDIGGGVTRTDWQFGPHGDNNYQIRQDGVLRTKWDFVTTELSHVGPFLAQSLNCVNPFGGLPLSASSNFSASGSVGNLFAPSLQNGNYVFMSVGRSLGTSEAALFGLADAGTSPYVFLGIAGRSSTDFRIMPTGNIILGNIPDYGHRLSVDGVIAASVDLIAGRGLRIMAPVVPATATAAGVAGDVAWDASFLYVCVATNTWKRAAIAAW